MPYRRGDSPHYWISWTDASGKQLRKSSGTADKAEATALEQKHRAESYTARKKSGGISAAFDAVLIEYLSREGRLIPRNLSMARHLMAAFKNKSLLDVKPHDIQAYIEDRQDDEVAVATINRELVLLSAAINEYNRRFGASIPNLASGMKMREPEGRVRWITHEEAERLIAHAAPHIADFITLGLFTGMRRREMMELTWDRVDFNTGLILLEAQHTKTKRRRAIPIHDKVTAALSNCKTRWPESPLVFDGIGDFKRGFAGACNRAGITDFTPHDMRHTFASWLVQQGVELYAVQQLLGHSSIKLTERYAHLAPRNLVDAVRKLA